MMATAIQFEPGPLASLAGIVGAEYVVTDPVERRVFSQDVFAQGFICAAIVRPGSVDALAACVGAMAAHDIDLQVRGGGMSYTGGYLPTREASIVIDLSRLDRIVAINAADMVVTVEAGCTWDTLRTALAPLGLQTPYWGPLSGLRSTVGGAISQNSVFFGSGMHGTAADSVAGLDVVIADGSIVTTGSAATPGGTPFFRHYGPDLTGLFTGDAGAFGVKARITLRLIRAKPCRRYASFAFGSRDDLVTTMQEIGRAGIATECFAFDPFLQSVRMKRASLASDLKTLAAVVTGQRSLARGLREGVRMAVAGRRFADGVDWPLHVALQEHSDAGAEAALAEARSIAIARHGRETENTVPKAVHAAPFGPMNGMIGVDGERWVPVHGVVAHSRTTAFLTALDELYAREAEEMARRSVTSGYLLTTVQASAMLIEPVFYWPDARLELHERAIEPSFMAKLPRHADNPETRAYVSSLRATVIALFVEFGAAHFQVGKTYPYQASRLPDAAKLAQGVKTLLDPGGRMSPGALGLK